MASLRPPAKLFDIDLSKDNYRKVREMDSNKKHKPRENDFISGDQTRGDSFNNIHPGTSEYMKKDFYTEPAGDTKEYRAKMRLENQNTFD